MKYSLRKYKPLILPSNNTTLYKYIQNNRVKMLEGVLNSIEYAVEKNLEVVEVFLFEGSEFIVTLNNSCFEKNVNQIYDFYVEQEKYELCKRAVRIKDKLKKKYEQKKKAPNIK